ncbi:MAG TPA: ribosome biogenesis GTP-binding protein YihA/YsxC [Tenuifilaceae bacterium]|nr:ribosome biogenesis GTP-binding protein YihA/YsxC [Tenuifilaceae bacterium]HPE19093.1 ribosome biogenesis GTP-binding protein YihA/YsxC [Tenuifilaceae bacterium]HPJ46602.1 ribosome biogenesis GTP-binding protein YihA/YsxC [Tenuifilaceae bacterium]HPQ34962.1 ribosome biogenesis GTP-binding protein YihA/YsxC [Tenuifilaceae bacterium]HRX68760.1 ribosome biogenesis GTP-binding protein YihA/YsxC [Tenuifilaceae bacterium]
MVIRSAKFVKSSPKVELCPPANLPEYAFIGRSNVGKSSLINMITGLKALAKVSGTPGKTQLINHFEINESWYLVDLPGYGYAKVSKDKREVFSSMITKYIMNRDNLNNLFILIDSRLEPQAIDLTFINWLGSNQIPFSLIFTKTDKLSSNTLNSSIARYKKELMKTWEELPHIFTCSAVTRTGREEILSFIEEVNASTEVLA